MVLDSPNASHRAGLAFWAAGTEDDNNEAVIDSEDKKDGEETKDDVKGIERKSMYVVEFDEMLKTVLQHEYFLFDDSETKLFDAYDKLSDSAKYLLVRLCLRKHDQWIRKNDLKYHRELGDKLSDAMRELCSAAQCRPAVHDPAVKIEAPDFIDLTFDDEEPLAHSSKIRLEEPSATSPISQLPVEPNYTAFADDDSKADLRQLMNCLKREELHDLAKERKIKPTGLTKDDLINALLQSANTQTTLPFALKGKGKDIGGGLKQTILDGFARGSKVKTEARFRTMVMKKLEAVIKLNSDVVRLFQRVNVVYFRSTQYSASLMTSAILARAKRRNYTAYRYSRTATIWFTREALLDYEDALRLEGQVDDLLEGNGRSRGRSRSIASKTPGPPGKSPTKRRRTDGSSPVKKVEGGDDKDYVPLDTNSVDEEKARVQNAREVKKIFEQVYERWKTLAVETSKLEGRARGLERFHCGHVLTRIVCKGAYALGVLKEFDAELAVLEMLLGQRRWRRGRRGKWYERRALILTTHIKGSTALLRAREGVLAALSDDDTHIIYRSKLHRRLATLEKKLKLGDYENPVDNGLLSKPEAVYIKGERVYRQYDQAGKLLQPTIGKQSKAEKIPDSKQQVLVFQESAITFVDSKKVKPENPTPPVMTGKSVWRGDDGESVYVEQLALQHYNKLGFKGYFCEGRIITTLFGLLCWDVIFATIDGAFETPYQIAPMDIAEDTFLYSREDIVKERLKQLREADPTRIMEMVDEAYTVHEKEMCIGVHWDMFEKVHLQEIAGCIGGCGLAVICQLLCEDYSGRTGGVPDLIVWNMDELSGKFVEVKGPGDTLQENQKVWIEALQQAKVSVEVCHVAQIGAEKAGKAGRAKGKAKVAAGSKRKRAENDEAEEIFVESEDEPESGPSNTQLDNPPAQERPQPQVASPSRRSAPATPRRLQMEVVITTPSPRSSRRRPSVSPEV